MKLKKADRDKKSFSKLTGSGSGLISASIRPEPDPLKLRSGRNRIFFLIYYPVGFGSKQKWPDPADPESDLRSGRSLH